MSGYPYGYPYQGQPPPPQQYPSYPPYGAFPPPPSGFGTTPPQSQQQPQQQQHYAPPATSYHANSQSAYDYNISSIPGLGTPSAGHPTFPAPYNGAWNQGGFGTVAPQAPYPSHPPPAPASSTPTKYPYPQTQAPVPQVPPPTTTANATSSRIQSNTAPKSQPKVQPVVESKSQDSNDGAQEEGEIDDGYFDDLYDDASKAASVTNETLPVADKSSGEPGEDSLDQEPNFYDTDMEDVSTGRKLSGAMARDKIEVNVKSQRQQDRDRSRSYSPHLSPTEENDPVQGNAVASTQMRQSSPTEAANSSSNSASSNTNQVKNGAGVEAVAKMTSPTPGITPAKSFASVFEASNEAKKAILRLLPHGVKYQTYIDEGFDPKLIKDLFTQLNLPTDSVTSGPSEKPATTQNKVAQPTSTQPAQQTQPDNTDKKQEARKDKIARLMAEKKAKLAATTNTGAAAEAKGVKSSTVAAAVSAPQTKPPITRAEKDRLLQQKVEALRNKAREAKKLAQKSAPVEGSKPNVSSPKPGPPQASTVLTQSTVAPRSTSGTPLSSASQSAALSPVVSAGLSLPQAPQINQRKRPVAADFMDYPPLPSKRPSLANRQNSSLVISISDDEDDEDDDVEMEVDSATEDSPSSLPQALPHTRRGLSIRDFPPLSNVKNTRQLHSPVNGSSVSGTKNANVDLETKEKAILEMQKKIKELEAKKEAKARSGNVTPRSPSASGNAPPEKALQTPVRSVATHSEPDDKTTPSAQLLQEAEAASVPMPQLATRKSQTEDELPVRLTSAQVSGKSAKALEKAERLRRMQEEMQKLQAEIDQEEDDVEVEEQRNSDEVEVTPQTGETQFSQASPAAKEPEPGMSLISEKKVNLADSIACEDRGVEVIHTEVPAATNLQEELTASNSVTLDAQAMQMDSSPDSPSGNNNAVETLNATTLVDQIATHTPAMSEATKLSNEPGSVNTPSREQSAIADSDESDDYEPPEPKIDARVGVDSPRFSPAPAKVDHLATSTGGNGAKTNREVFVGSSHPIGTSLTHRKAVIDIVPDRQTTFAPYESPLRYYRAYRFHENYNDGVPGGLKSLTYSNRLDPNKEMCPDEWEGNDCPRGDACQFQHFQSIIAPDSEVILELGSSDEFTGDQKRDFNKGLREVVASFQKSKVRDFRTIAQAIVEFRRRFLGDPSKVLRLEGVSI